MSLVDNDPDSTEAPGDANELQVQESTKMPNEILDLIFEAVAIEHRARLRGVSQRRKVFIEKIGYGADPVFVGDAHSHSPACVPCYPAHISLRLNPAIDDSRYPVSNPLVILRQHQSYKYFPYFRFRCVGEIKDLRQHQTEFITMPPVTTAAIGFGAGDPSMKLKVPRGVRVHHLLKLAKKKGMPYRSIYVALRPHLDLDEPLKWNIGYHVMNETGFDEVGLLSEYWKSINDAREDKQITEDPKLETVV